MQGLIAILLYNLPHLLFYARLASYKDPILGEVNPIEVLHVLGVRSDIWLDLMLVKSHQSVMKWDMPDGQASENMFFCGRGGGYSSHFSYLDVPGSEDQ